MIEVKILKEISLVAVDLDGTLLTSEGLLAPRGGGLLKQAAQRGVRVVLSTTRNPDTVQSLCRLLEISDPIICTNGAQVFGSPDGPVWAYYSIPQEAALAITQLADTHGWELSTTVGSMTYWRQRPGQTLGAIAPNITIVATNSAAIIDEPVRVLANQLEAIDSIKSLCQSQLSGQCYAETYYKPNGLVHSLGIFPLQANKGTALALVLERLCIESERVMAIGDNPNDLSMFPYARISVAMANAPNEVKEKATVVAPSNDDEGVAWALETFAFGQ